MTELKKKKARWFGLLSTAFLVMAYAGPAHLWILPLCIVAMIVCIRKGELWEWGGIK